MRGASTSWWERKSVWVTSFAEIPSALLSDNRKQVLKFAKVGYYGGPLQECKLYCAQVAVGDFTIPNEKGKPKCTARPVALSLATSPIYCRRMFSILTLTIVSCFFVTEFGSLLDK